MLKILWSSCKFGFSLQGFSVDIFGCVQNQKIKSQIFFSFFTDSAVIVLIWPSDHKVNETEVEGYWKTDFPPSFLTNDEVAIQLCSISFLYRNIAKKKPTLDF